MSGAFASTIVSRTRAAGFLAAAVVTLTIAGPSDLRGTQAEPFFDVTLADGSVASLPVERDRGYPAVPSEALGALGWTAEAGLPGETVFMHIGGAALRLSAGSPMLVLNDRIFQMADPPYSVGTAVFVPLQVVVDLIPEFGPGGYTVAEAAPGSAGTGSVTATTVADVLPTTDVVPAIDPAAAPVGPDSTSVIAADSAAPAADVSQDTGQDADATVFLVAPSTPPSPTAFDLIRGGDRLVVIDAGHGGADPGAVGPGGIAEKTVALSVALALARELASRPGLDVRVTRDRDIQVATEYRRAWADEWTGDRPSVFVSIHVNALPGRTGVRGFETYSWGCPQSEQDVLVMEFENGLSAAERPAFGYACTGDPSDHSLLSADLAMKVQQELGAFHPGPDRGVRQTLFDVLRAPDRTGVLVEIGFITNPEEARALARPDFHRQAAASIARAIDDYFESAPPGGLP
jgi:N-acetylmuramoyl-L-alanine amidase